MTSFRSLLAAAFLAAAAVVRADPPVQVARLALVEGPVSLRPAGTQAWSAAPLNRPLTAGDTLWVDDGARAELRTGGAVIRVDRRTAVEVLTVGDGGTQLRLPAGTVQVVTWESRPPWVVEVATPAGAVTLQKPGRYRVAVNEPGTGTAVLVGRGAALVTASGTEIGVAEGEEALLSAGPPAAHAVSAARSRPDDPFDAWCRAREESEPAPAGRHLLPDVIGGEELERAGQWVESPGHGPVWRPPALPGWAPFRAGHWTRVEPWGLTFVDDASWGFAPSHYGRWLFLDDGWAWLPGPRSVRPVFAPHLVAFVKGPLPGTVAWVPLGPGEPWHPPYAAGEVYTGRVNAGICVTGPVTLVNRDAPGGVTALSEEAFAGAQAAVPAPGPLPPPGLEGRPVQARLLPPPHPGPAASRPADAGKAARKGAARPGKKGGKKEPAAAKKKGKSKAGSGTKGKKKPQGREPRG